MSQDAERDSEKSHGGRSSQSVARGPVRMMRVIMWQIKEMENSEKTVKAWSTQLEDRAGAWSTQLEDRVGREGR